MTNINEQQIRKWMPVNFLLFILLFCSISVLSARIEHESELRNDLFGADHELINLELLSASHSNTNTELDETVDSTSSQWTTKKPAFQFSKNPQENEKIKQKLLKQYHQFNGLTDFVDVTKLRPMDKLQWNAKSTSKPTSKASKSALLQSKMTSTSLKRRHQFRQRIMHKSALQMEAELESEIDAIAELENEQSIDTDSELESELDSETLNNVDADSSTQVGAIDSIWKKTSDAGYVTLGSTTATFSISSDRLVRQAEQVQLLGTYRIGSKEQAPIYSTVVTVPANTAANANIALTIPLPVTYQADYDTFYVILQTALSTQFDASKTDIVWHVKLKPKSMWNIYEFLNHFTTAADATGNRPIHAGRVAQLKGAITARRQELVKDRKWGTWNTDNRVDRTTDPKTFSRNKADRIEKEYGQIFDNVDLDRRVASAQKIAAMTTPANANVMKYLIDYLTAEVPVAPLNTANKVVVIGGGPNGLLSAFHALKAGNQVTVFESRPTYTRMINISVGGGLYVFFKHAVGLFISRPNTVIGERFGLHHLFVPLRSLERTLRIILTGLGVKFVDAQFVLPCPPVNAIPNSKWEAIGVTYTVSTSAQQRDTISKCLSTVELSARLCPANQLPEIKKGGKCAFIKDEIREAFDTDFNI